MPGCLKELFKWFLTGKSLNGPKLTSEEEI